jgi:hypothetical protein
VQGFRTGDMVRAVVRSGKKQGTYVGRVAVRATGSFNITTMIGTVQAISYRFCVLLHRSDGYSYSTKSTRKEGIRYHDSHAIQGSGQRFARYSVILLMKTSGLHHAERYGDIFIYCCKLAIDSSRIIQAKGASAHICSVLVSYSSPHPHPCESPSELLPTRDGFDNNFHKRKLHRRQLIPPKVISHT